MDFRKPTSAVLEAEADRLLRQDRKEGGSSSDEFDLLQERDRKRKGKRQYKLAECNQEVFLAQISPELRLDPEQLLIREEEKVFAKKVLLDTLLQFEKDVPVKQVILAVLLYDVDFRSTRGLSEATGMTPKMTHAAKERLKYFVQNENLQARIVSSK